MRVAAIHFAAAEPDENDPELPIDMFLVMPLAVNTAGTKTSIITMKTRRN
jgi:hypothetical protein